MRFAHGTTVLLKATTTVRRASITRLAKMAESVLPAPTPDQLPKRRSLRTR